MKIAITGATGFIGSHLLARLQETDVELVAVSRRPAPSPAAGCRVRHVQLDLHQCTDDAYERLGRPDLLAHLAWGHLDDFRSPAHFEVELAAHYAFLRRLVVAGLPAVCVAGTCLEYGLQAGCLHEECPMLPVTPYGFAKAALLRQLQFLQAVQPFALTWARLFYLHGPGQPRKAILRQLSVAVESGVRVFNMSGGEQLRDYLPINELADLLARLLLAPGNHGIVNVCSGTPISIRRLVEEWLAQHGRQMALNLGHYPYPDYEPMAFWGSTDKLRAILAATRPPSPRA